ncbi:MAG: hypothetical protein IJZ57_04160 [Clostridia bacterium]|nr:hypothetical protein [Clostridia bacterium]
MGKTVKSRLFICITSIICVIALCIIANSGIPALYQSHAEKVAAQDAATRTTKQVVTTTTTTAPATEAPVTEESIVYEIEESTTEAVSEESTEEEVIEEETTTEAADDSSEESFLDKILNFLTSIFDMIFSGELFAKLGDLFSGVLGIFGL